MYRGQSGPHHINLEKDIFCLDFGVHYRLRENLQSAKVYLDANIFIYTLEAHPQWVPLLTDLFSGLYRHEFAASTSSLTLSECLVMPFKKMIPI